MGGARLLLEEAVPRGRRGATIGACDDCAFDLVHAGPQALLERRPPMRPRLARGREEGVPRRARLVQLGHAERIEAVPVEERPPVIGAPLPKRQLDARGRDRYWPTGCQTVLSSRNAAISHGLWPSAAPCTTRFTFSAAARSSSAESPSQPARSRALTSMCAASHGASSPRWPVRMLTAPPGTSEVASASASSIAASGCFSDASATTAFPPVSAGVTRVTRPRSGGSSGATIPTTPGGSGTVKLK